MHFVKKDRVETGPDGWKFHYEGKCRPFILPVTLPKQKPSKPSDRNDKPGVSATSPDPPNNYPLGDDLRSLLSSDTDISAGSLVDSDANSDEERADDLTFWFADEKGPEQKEVRKSGTPGSAPIVNRPRLLSNQHDTIFNKLAPVIDMGK